MKVQYSKYALSDVYSLLAPVAASNPRAAARLYARIQLVVQQIGESPDISQEIADRPSVFRVPLLLDQYTIYYKIVNDEVVILRILRRGREGVEVKL
jgi:plasmid stabilization system protein ParE